MKNLHLIMQPKGGSGKSFTAIHLIQFLTEHDSEVDSFDLDAANNTLSQFKALNAAVVDISHPHKTGKIDPRKFDGLLKTIVASKASDIVVDIGASIIGEFSLHLQDLDFYNMSDDLELKVFIHTPISGGQGLLDNLGGLKTVYDAIGSKARYVVWSNPFFGEVLADGKELEEMSLIQSMSPHIQGIIKIPDWDSDVKKDDVLKMVTLKLSYEEINGSSEFNLFSKSRLKKIKQDFFARIKVTGIAEQELPT